MIELERLVASALGELDGPADQQVEEHVVSCGRCAAIYTSLLRLGPAIAELVRRGGVGMPVTGALVERLEAEGLISRRYALRPGEPVPCSVGADDVYSLTVYEADLAGVERVDLVRAGERLADIPFDAAAGRVYVLTRSEVLRTLPTTRVALRLVAVEATDDRVLGDYVLEHTGFRATPGA